MRTALALMFVLVSSSAWADAVPSPPDNCPAGTIPDTCHGGPHCRITECKSDADCNGAPCRTVRECVATISCGGLRPADAPPPPEFKVVRGECSDECNGSCERVSYCGAKPTTITGLFGCAGADGGAGAVVVATLLALVARAMRSRKT